MSPKLIGQVPVLLQPANLVLNPSVEQPESGDWPDNWAWSAANATRVVTQARTGTKSLRLNPTIATAEWRANVFAVIGSQNYRVRGYFKGTGSNETFLTIRWWSDAGGTQFVSENNISLEGSFGAWTEKSGIFSAPANAFSADISFRCPASTTADLYGDDFYVG